MVEKNVNRDDMFHVKHWVKIRKYFPGNNYSKKTVIRDNMFHVKH